MMGPKTALPAASFIVTADRTKRLRRSPGRNEFTIGQSPFKSGSSFFNRPNSTSTAMSRRPGSHLRFIGHLERALFPGDREQGPIELHKRVVDRAALRMA